MTDHGNRRGTWPPSTRDDQGNRHPDMCPRPACDLVDRFWSFAKLCTCGNPEDLAGLVLAGLDAHHAPGDLGHAWPGEWVAANLALAYMLDAWELTEHGSTIHGGWLTPDGAALREALRTADLRTVLDWEHTCDATP